MKNLITGGKVGMVLLCAAILSACSTSTGAQSSKATSTAADTTAITTGAATTSVQLASVKMADLVTFDEEDTRTAWSADESTGITLAGTSAEINGSGAEFKDGSVSITAAGTYVLSGQLSDGQVVVDVQDKGTVHLVLNGVTLQDSDSAPIYIKEAGKAVITLQEGTDNRVTDGATYVFADAATDEPSAAIFSKADLTINGTGKLTVTASYKDGVSSKDDLKIAGGTIAVQAADDGIVGKDLIAIQDGTFSIKAEGDGIKATNDEDTAKGFIAIADGTFDITSGNDGIQAETAEVIEGGTYTLVTGGGNENGEVKVEQGFGTTTETPTDTESTSAKGLKAGGDITVNGGTFTLDSADDAVHSNSNVSVTNGEFEIASGDDGIHADALTSLSGGTINITKSYEGVEGANITVAGGDIGVVASDDGVNAGGGTTAEGQDPFASSGSNQLTISGGNLTVSAVGDGLDSNGSITMSGGTVIVNGPTGSGNGTLDFDGSFEITGGILAAAGSAGMAQAPTEESGQYSIAMTFPQVQKAGTLVHLQDSEGNHIMTFAPAKDYQTVVISSPDLKKGGSYTLYSGGSSTGSEVDGYYADGAYEGGTKVIDFEVSDSITWLNESGVTTGGGGMGGPGGGGGRQGGMRPDGGVRPDDEVKTDSETSM